MRQTTPGGPRLCVGPGDGKAGLSFSLVIRGLMQMRVIWSLVCMNKKSWLCLALEQNKQNWGSSVRVNVANMFGKCCFKIKCNSLS